MRSLTNAIASAVALTALVATGFAHTQPNALPRGVIMLIVAFVVWITGSFISRKMEEDGEADG